MKINFFKLGAVFFMILGVLHTVFHLLKDVLGHNNDIQMQTLTAMNNTVVEMMGKHNLLQFYNGFSITMGLLLFAFGLQAYFIENPKMNNIFINVIISIIVFILSVIYFHPLAYLFILAALICFSISLLKANRSKNRESK